MIRLFNLQHCLLKKIIIKQQNNNQPVQIDTGIRNLGVLNIDFNPDWTWERNPSMGELLYSSSPPPGGRSYYIAGFPGGATMGGGCYTTPEYIQYNYLVEIDSLKWNKSHNWSFVTIAPQKNVIGGNSFSEFQLFGHYSYSIIGNPLILITLRSCLHHEWIFSRQRSISDYIKQPYRFLKLILYTHVILLD